MITFEECINFIETELNIKLPDCYKQILQFIYEGKQVCYMPARATDKRILGQSIALLLYIKEAQYGM